MAGRKRYAINLNNPVQTFKDEKKAGIIPQPTAKNRVEQKVNREMNSNIAYGMKSQKNERKMYAIKNSNAVDTNRSSIDKADSRKRIRNGFKGSTK